jgi:hypothetical protein
VTAFPYLSVTPRAIRLIRKPCHYLSLAYFRDRVGPIFVTGHRQSSCTEIYPVATRRECTSPKIFHDPLKNFPGLPARRPAVPEPPWSPRSGSILPGSRALGVVKAWPLVAAVASLGTPGLRPAPSGSSTSIHLSLRGAVCATDRRPVFQQQIVGCLDHRAWRSCPCQGPADAALQFFRLDPRQDAPRCHGRGRLRCFRLLRGRPGLLYAFNCWGLCASPSAI